MDIHESILERILILDGAMGTMLQSYGLVGNSEEFNLSHPEIVSRIHSDYITAGADIIETNSFSANRISQEGYGLAAKAEAMAERAAKIARAAADAADRKVWVAGSIGPTGKSLSLAQDISDPAFRPFDFDDMAAAYGEQVRGLLAGGVDLLLLETCFDALNAKAAIYAIKHLAQADGIPIMVSVSPNDRSGRTLTGQTLEAFYRSVEHASPLSFGINCSLGAEGLAPMVAEASSWTGCAVSCHPNAGLPNEMGGYDETPSQMANAISKMAREGIVNIVGGCCGTTPEHIRAIAAAVKGLRPRLVPEPTQTLSVSGLESVTIDTRRTRFTNIGERTNVAGSRKFAKLIAAGQYETALQVAADQIGNGASIIDVNMDDAMLDSTAEMRRFLRYIANDPAVAKAATMVDSSHWETLVTGLKNAQGKCIVNSISLKEGETAFLAKAAEIKALGAAVVVMAFDEQGQATTYERKVEVCRRAYELLTGRLGFKPCEIIFDVNVLSVGTGIAEHSRYGIDFIEAVRWIKHNLPGALTSGGISNLSFAFRGNNTVREAMHSAFLYHAIAAGLDMGIVNPAMLKVYDEIEPSLLKCVEDVILDRSPEATERLIEKAQKIMEEGEAEKSGKPAAGSPEEDLPVEERLVRSLVKGSSEGLETDIRECLCKGSPAVDIIEGPLMSGMSRVGSLFAEGKMFLPQVVKSAKTMRDAVAILEPYLDGSGAGSEKHKVVIATVKGDVHDIGKNITAIVLRCNGFEVADLGVMVPKEVILAKAEEMGADIIGVSGLITPSLFQMEELCREMASRGMTTPLLIGGATTSALHTAVKLAPLYDHVYYGSDASASAVLAGHLMSDRHGTEAAEHARQLKLREMYAGTGSPASASVQVPPFVPQSYLHGQYFKDIPTRELSISDVLPYFDWKMYYAVMGIKNAASGKTLDDELLQLNEDTVRMIDEMKREGLCRIMISARFDACHSEGDDIIAVACEGGKGGDSPLVPDCGKTPASEGNAIGTELFRLPMLRQNGGKGLSLSDFVAPDDFGFNSPMGMFAISVHRLKHDVGCPCPSCETMHGEATFPDTDIENRNNPAVRSSLGLVSSDSLAAEVLDYESLMGRSLRVTFAEAASGWLDAELQKAMPKGSQIKIVKPAFGYASCPDHTLKRDVLALLPDAAALGISLTDSCAMIPDASICGLVFAHPSACYPDIKHLPKAALDDYAARRGLSPADKARFLDILL